VWKTLFPTLWLKLPIPFGWRFFNRFAGADPTSANTQRTDGPVSIPDNGIHMHFLVNGSSPDVLDAYKTALEGKGWTVTVVSSGGWARAGGATYTGTQGDTYGVFSGGGSASTADVSACAWPSKPSNPNCGGGNRQ
jgi:hypothetical protein